MLDGPEPVGRLAEVVDAKPFLGVAERTVIGGHHLEVVGGEPSPEGILMALFPVANWR